MLQIPIFSYTITVTQLLNYILTFLLIYYVIVYYFLQPKHQISPQQRTKRKYMLAYREVLRKMDSASREELELTLRNTVLNVKVEPVEEERKRNHNGKAVKIREEENRYYDPVLVEVVETVMGMLQDKGEGFEGEIFEERDQAEKEQRDSQITEKSLNIQGNQKNEEIGH